jgi:siroheme synthase
MEVWTVSLRDLQAGVDLSDRSVPGTVIIGEVVRLRAVLAAEADAAAAAAR